MEEGGTFPLEMPVPQFTIQVIRPGEGKVGVQLEDGRCGVISENEVEGFQEKYPNAIIVN